MRERERERRQDNKTEDMIHCCKRSKYNSSGSSPDGLFLTMFNELGDGADSPGWQCDRVKVHAGLVTQTAVTRPLCWPALHRHIHADWLTAHCLQDPHGHTVQPKLREVHNCVHTEYQGSEPSKHGTLHIPALLRTYSSKLLQQLILQTQYAQLLM